MQTTPRNVSTLPLRTMREGESYVDYVKRMRGVEAVEQLNRTFHEKRLEIATEQARNEGTQRGLRLGHTQGFWWGFVCGCCFAAVAGALSVIGWAWLTRGPLL